MSKRINTIIKICASLKDDGKGDFKRIERMEFLDEEENKNMRESINFEEDTDRWMRIVVNDLCKILGLHSPMFLGSSRRAVASGSGAYAFSAAKNSGKSVVVKIVPERELQPYKEMIRKYISVDEKHRFILPQIYLAKTFNELSYSPPENWTSPKFAVVVMEELEKMPEEMIDIYFSKKIDGDGLRYFMSDKESLRSAISKLIDEDIRKNILDEVSLGKISFNEALSNDEKEYLLNMLFNNIKLYFEDILTKELANSNYDYHNEAFDLEEEISNCIERAIKNSLEDLSNRIIISSDVKQNIYYWNYLFARHFTSRLIHDRRVITTKPEPERRLLSNRFDSITKVKEAIDSLSSYGIRANDLHRDNIMIRPSTGELVISDIGHFMVMDSKAEKTYVS